MVESSPDGLMYLTVANLTDCVQSHKHFASYCISDVDGSCIRRKKKWEYSAIVSLLAISNHRIKSLDNDKITFSYRDRRHDNELKEMTLSAMEFIRRFLIHVLQFHFMKIRYYGFLANICKNKSILLIRILIGKDMESKIFTEETLQEKVLRLTGKDITLFPYCKVGRMMYLVMLPGQNTS